VFKYYLQNLANETELEIRVAHYPPYCSKYNPIEHRMFPHVTRACQGVIFENFEEVQKYIEPKNDDLFLILLHFLSYHTNIKEFMNTPIIFFFHPLGEFSELVLFFIKFNFI